MGVKRPELVLAGAVLVSLPMVPDILHGDISPAAALVRFIGAILVCWVAGAVLSNVFGRYGEQARRAEIEAMIEEARRRSAEAHNPSPSPE